MKSALTSLLLLASAIALPAQQPRQLSGIYPHLAMFNNEGECGTGAVVPWADRLWVITYGPHLPFGSSDKLYEITPDLQQIIRPESVGGTPANRMIHKETQQLLIGPYVIDAQRQVRVIVPNQMPGRITGNARHLTDPARKAYYATMEEGLYEVDLRSLEVTGLIKDGNKPKPDFSKETRPATLASELPGYHGKGLYSGHGRLVYANNGDRDKRVLTDPATPSGALGEWTTPGQDWQLVRRNQFTEVTGPGGLTGNEHPETDPVWSIGWDHRSLILMCLSGEGSADTPVRSSSPSGEAANDRSADALVRKAKRSADATVRNAEENADTPVRSSSQHGEAATSNADEGVRTPLWHSYRLPKSSHSYDGAHGWNTEWPRIRDIGEEDLLMTMHGTFWKFPRTFTPASSAGIVPRSNYLKVIGDFARWGDRLVLGCDDSANKEFLNVRKAKGVLAGPGKSQSNLWFLAPEKLDALGPIIARGAVWLEDAVTASVPSEPYLFAGYTHRSLHLVSGSDADVDLIIEADINGNGQWQEQQTLTLAAKGSRWIEFPTDAPGIWLRLRAKTDAAKLSAVFHYRSDDARPATAAAMFDGIATQEDTALTGGVLHARGAEFKTLRFISAAPGQPNRVYDMGSAFDLTPKDDPAGLAWTSKNAAIPEGVLEYDAASILYVDDKGRWRLPRGHAAFDKQSLLGLGRVCREVCTERDLFNAGGTFFELPAENAGGFAKIRPVTTHNRRIQDYASYRGLLVISGLKTDAQGEHIIRSSDGKTALWAGAVDDLWQFGKPRGFGGPWKDSPVTAGVPSDPYLFTGYDQKHLTLASDKPAKIRIEADITGTGLWLPYQEFQVKPGNETHHTFPPSYGAYWLRCISDADAVVSAQLRYE